MYFTSYIKIKGMSSFKDYQELPLKSMKIEIGKASHKGMVRSTNEDNLLSLDLFLEESSKESSFRLYALADGVGGYEGGEIASSLALRVLAQKVVRSLFLPEILGELPILVDGMRAANSEVYTQGQAKGNSMGTTLVAALVIDNVVYIANVGDSRAYLLEESQLHRITRDHSLVADMVAENEITPEEVYTHPHRNVITRCLGAKPDVEIDTFIEEVKPGSSLLLCSDGLWETVRESQIKAILTRADGAQSACKQLVELANQNGGVDNVSVVVVRFSE
jgi:serine/threonine protein phosphatase PrpC